MKAWQDKLEEHARRKGAKEKSRKRGNSGVEPGSWEKKSEKQPQEGGEGKGQRGNSCKTEINYRTEWHSGGRHETYFLALFLARTGSDDDDSEARRRMEEVDRFGGEEEGRIKKKKQKRKKELFQRAVHTSPDCRWARRFQWISRSLSRECRCAAFTRMRDSHVGHSPSLYFSFLYFIHATLSALSFSLARMKRADKI